MKDDSVDLDWIISFIDIAKSCSDTVKFQKLANEVVNELISPTYPVHACSVVLIDPTTNEEQLISFGGSKEQSSGSTHGYSFIAESGRQATSLGYLRILMRERKLGESELEKLRFLHCVLEAGARMLTLASSNDIDRKLNLYNFACLQTYLEKSISECTANKKPLSLIFLDLDDFKLVNDKGGQIYGDYVLKEVAKLLKLVCFETSPSFPARHGGEEFVIVLPQTDEQKAIEIGKILNERIKMMKLRPLGNNKINVTASIGVSSFPHHDTSLDGLLDKADKAKSLAKWRGKDDTKSFSEYAALDAETRLQLEESDKKRKFIRAMMEWTEKKQLRIFNGFRCLSKKNVLWLKDVNGEKAECRIDWTLVPKGRDCKEFVWKLQSDGRIENVRSTNLQEVGRASGQEKTNVVWVDLMFPTDLSQEIPSTADLCYEMIDSFVNENEYFSTDLRVFKEPLDVEIEIHFPKDRLPKAFNIQPGVASEYGKVLPGVDSTTIRYIGSQISPTHLERIRINWTW